MTIKPELAQELAGLFEQGNPLNAEVVKQGGRLAVNPRALMSLIMDKVTLTDEPIIGFIATEGAKTNLVEVEMGDHKYVGFVAAEQEGQPIELDDGRWVAVVPILGAIEMLIKQNEPVLNIPTEEKKRKEKKERKRKELPSEIQEIHQALSTQSPVLGNLEIRANTLDKQLFTIHEEKSAANGLTSVSMYEVDKYTKTPRGKIRKSKSTRHVVGFYLPTEEELADPEKLVLKTEELKTKLARKKNPRGSTASFGMIDEIDISIVTSDQLKSWRKTSFFTDLVAYKDGAASLKVGYEILKKAIGEGVEIQVQHITNGEADLVFVPEDARLPSELSAFDVAVEGEGAETKYVERVVGIMCVPDGISKKEQKAMANRVSKSLRLLYTTKSFAGRMPNILAVDKEMLFYWQKRQKNNEIILAPHNSKAVAKFLPRGEEIEPVGPSDVETIDFYTFEPNEPGIGAKFMQVIVKYGDGHEERLTLDHGAQFDNFPWDGITKPSFAMGISPYLDYLPPGQEKLWRRTLLLREAAQQGKRFFVPENALARDLAQRLGIEQFTELAEQVGYENAGVEIPQRFERKEDSKIHHLGIVYSHGHVDHIGWGGLFSANVPVITTDASIPFFETMFLGGGGGFASEAIFRRERDTLLTKRSNRVFTPPLYMPEPYQEIRLGRGQVGVKLLPASHSIYGGAMVCVTIYDKSDKPIKTVVYTGDYNFDNKEMMAETERYLESADILITDTTNIRPDSYGKPSVGVTREIMREGFREVLSNSNRSSIVELAWNNVGDLHLVQQVAAELGRNVYVYPKMSLLLHLLHQLDETRLKSEHAYNWRGHNPVPLLGADVYPWSYPKMTLRKGERMLEEMMKVEKHADLSEAEPHVLFTPPNPMLEHTMMGANMRQYSEVIRAHYWPYGIYDKNIVRQNFRFTRNHGLTYYTDLELRGGNIFSAKKPRFHMSGHARPEDSLAMIKRLASKGTLKQVIPIHGDARQYAAQQIRSQHKDLVVYDRFAKNGFTIPLYKKD